MSSKRRSQPEERNTALVYIRQSVTKNDSDKASPERQRVLARMFVQAEELKSECSKMPKGINRRGS